MSIIVNVGTEELDIESIAKDSAAFKATTIALRSGDELAKQQVYTQLILSSPEYKEALKQYLSSAIERPEMERRIHAIYETIVTREENSITFKQSVLDLIGGYLDQLKMPFKK